MMKRLLRNMRAFSPVIAAIILMLIAVAAGVVVYGYVMGWLGAATNVPSSTKGELQFDSLYASAGSGTITVYVRNVGQKELTLSRVYVDGANQTFTLTDYTLSVGEVSGSISVSHSMTAGLTYEVKVTCTDGTLISQSVEAKA